MKVVSLSIISKCYTKQLTFLMLNQMGRIKERADLSIDAEAETT
ncbi:MAG TPA: hypothetical protein VE076_02100 [Nitrososphaeraceae archaeon]|nr:hypothetical protein [Nitrososphaeraceae archaeon]